MLCAPLDGRPPESPAQSDVPSLFLPWVGMASLLESEPQLFLQRRFLWRGWWFKNVGRFRVKLFLSVQSRRGLCWPLVPAVCPAGAVCGYDLLSDLDCPSHTKQSDEHIMVQGREFPWERGGGLVNVWYESVSLHMYWGHFPMPVVTWGVAILGTWGK